MLDLHHRVNRRGPHADIDDLGRPRSTVRLRFTQDANRVYLRTRAKKSPSVVALGEPHWTKSLGFSLSFRSPKMNNNAPPILGPSAYLVKREAEQWPETSSEAYTMLMTSLYELDRVGRCRYKKSNGRRQALLKLESLAMGKNTIGLDKLGRLQNIIKQYCKNSEPLESEFAYEHDLAITMLRRCQHQLELEKYTYG